MVFSNEDKVVIRYEKFCIKKKVMGRIEAYHQVCEQYLVSIIYE